VGGSDPVVPIRTHDHEVLYLRLGQHVLQQVSGRGIHPLQIVEEQHERMPGTREYPEETPEHPAETVQHILWGNLRSGWLFTYDQLELRNQADDELTMLAQSSKHPLAPLCDLRVRTAEELTNEAAARLHQRGIGDIPSELIELAGSKPAARLDEVPLQLVHECRLADPGIS
jgi:hypothetical protein